MCIRIAQLASWWTTLSKAVQSFKKFIFKKIKKEISVRYFTAKSKGNPKLRKNMHPSACQSLAFQAVGSW